MKILALDTSGLVATVALAEDDRLTAVYSIQNKTTHSQILMPMMDSIKNLVGLEMETIDAIAVAAGPGSFTGLRIGSATAKGLGLALDKPIVSVPTVDGIAYNLYGQDKIICPMMDARRSQVYTGIYTFEPVNEGLGNERSYDMKIIHEQFVTSIEDIADKLNEIGKEVILLGDGVPVYKEKLSELLKVSFSEAPIFNNRQSAATVAALGIKYYKEGKMIHADDFAPEYLRASQAEREAREKEKRS
ncbi:MAG: tRNA (adenosine(37)-N6)-threonylcarbamoyltransferase complex dimerization subunit type 1 TsaB [Butyrivibrio sp.]|nr:tRNA (adenosine(37)-N6)-threonylcarbamoyltransferase complex dimerization subunit type 1 TsaB [Butyrivibrio sp.]